MTNLQLSLLTVKQLTELYKAKKIDKETVKQLTLDGFITPANYKQITR